MPQWVPVEAAPADDALVGPADDRPGREPVLLEASRVGLQVPGRVVTARRTVGEAHDLGVALDLEQGVHVRGPRGAEQEPAGLERRRSPHPPGYPWAAATSSR